MNNAQACGKMGSRLRGDGARAVNNSARWYKYMQGQCFGLAWIPACAGMTLAGETAGFHLAGE